MDQSIEGFLLHLRSTNQRKEQYFGTKEGVGGGGGAKQAQSGFLVLMDYVIKQPDLPQIVGRYQQAMVSLNLAVWPGAWRMPARMIINTESTVGYNNKLKQTVAGMKLAINNEVNPDTQKSWP